MKQITIDGVKWGDWALNQKPVSFSEVHWNLWGDSGGGVTDGIQDTWSEGSHEKALTPDSTGSEGTRQTLHTHTTNPCAHSHTHKLFVMNPKLTPVLAGRRRRC